MRPAARAGDRGSMRTGAPGSPGRYDALRIMIIDDHEISRTAFCALLRSEGADVVADLSTGPDALAMARALRPDVVIVDVTPTADTGFGIARRLRALLPTPLIVILTSSTDRTRFGAQLDGHVFIAKADICAAAIARLARFPEMDGPESRNPRRLPQRRPSAAFTTAADTTATATAASRALRTSCWPLSIIIAETLSIVTATRRTGRSD